MSECLRCSLVGEPNGDLAAIELTARFLAVFFFETSDLKSRHHFGVVLW